MQPGEPVQGRERTGQGGGGLPGCSHGPSALPLKGLTQERLLFHGYIDEQHDDENAKDGQLQAPRDAVLRVLARDAIPRVPARDAVPRVPAQEPAPWALVPLAGVLFVKAPMLDPRD